MKKRSLVVYHADCVDGFTAAWAARQALGDVAVFREARYGEEPSLESFRGFDCIYIVDFSYSRELTMRLWDICSGLRVYDHHKTAEANLAGLDYCTFDMKRSGCGIVWDELTTPSITGTFSNIPRPWIINYAEDRDLWRFELPQSKEVNAFLRSQEQTFERWDEIYRMDLDDVRQMGAGCLAHIDAYVRAAVKHIQMAEMGGQVFPIVNITYESCSEVANRLCEMHPDSNLAGYWFVRGDGRVQYGFRSVGDFDVGEYARQFDGGGHKNSSGCVVDEIVHRVL